MVDFRRPGHICYYKLASHTYVLRFFLSLLRLDFTFSSSDEDDDDDADCSSSDEESVMVRWEEYFSITAKIYKIYITSYVVIAAFKDHVPIEKP